MPPSPKAPSTHDTSRLPAWLPLAFAALLEIVWILAPWGSMASFFSIVGCVFLTGLSLIIGIVLLIKGERNHDAAGILFCTVFLLPFLSWVLLDILKLHILLH